MSYCCIHENDIRFSFDVHECTITFENSTTDNNRSLISPIFKNTDISFGNQCPILNLDIPDSLKYKCGYSTPNNDENEEDNVDVRNHVKFFYLLMTSKPFRSRT